MNILILANHLNAGGISRYIINLAEALAQQKHKVWVASSGGEWVSLIEAKGIKHIHIPINTKSIYSFKVLLSFFKLKKFILKQKIDIIHCNTRVTQSLGFLLYQQFKIPYLGVFHGFYNPKMSRKIFKLSGLISIAVSNAVKEHLASDLKFDPDKIRVVYNGITLHEFLKGKDTRQKYGFKKNDYLVGLLGRISKEKGHFLAVAAIKRLLVKYNNIYLLVAGKGRLSDKLKSYLKEYGLKERVKFIDVPAPRFLDMLDLLIVPSRKEGFGYSIIEAFAKEVPVIGHNTGGISEIIRNRQNGLLFDEYTPQALSDKIEEAMLNGPLCKRMIETAKDDVIIFSSARMAIETEKVYREVML